jgi:hypothetical protein
MVKFFRANYTCANSSDKLDTAAIELSTTVANSFSNRPFVSLCHD